MPGKIWPPAGIRVTEVTMDLERRSVCPEKLLETARVGFSPKSSLVRLRKLLLSASCASVFLGCSLNKTPDSPAWPEQPSPSYPDPNGPGGDGASNENLDEGKSDSSPEPPPSSSLAKEYDGKEALETLNGKATYYADSLAGNHTANGDIYDPKNFTAAHKKLPFGTIVRVVRQDTGAVTYARINDRGPFGSQDRIIDLSRAAAAELQMMKAGVVDVRVEVVDRPKK
jgi:rare lipoprotein A